MNAQQDAGLSRGIFLDSYIMLDFISFSSRSINIEESLKKHNKLENTSLNDFHTQYNPTMNMLTKR